MEYYTVLPSYFSYYHHSVIISKWYNRGFRCFIYVLCDWHRRIAYLERAKNFFIQNYMVGIWMCSFCYAFASKSWWFPRSSS